MSQDKGKRAARWLADYLRPWFPSAEATPGGRPGRDILGTPGIAWEVKTSPHWRRGALAQVAGYAEPGELAVVVYYPPGVGEESTPDALAIMAVRDLLPLAVAAGYAPPPTGGEITGR